MKQGNICRYLRLDSFGVEFPFAITKTEMICFLKANHIAFDMSAERYVYFKSKLLALDIDFVIACQFAGENLATVVMSPTAYLEGRKMRRRYKEIQSAIEIEIGHPSNKRLIWMARIFGLVSIHPYWMYNGTTVEHYIENRFGPIDTISIIRQTDTGDGSACC